MAACTPLVFTQITEAVLMNLNEKAHKFGYQITAHSGSATITTPITLSFDYDYQPATEVLTIAITDKPFFVGCGIIADVLTKQIDGCR